MTPNPRLPSSTKPTAYGPNLAVLALSLMTGCAAQLDDTGELTTESQPLYVASSLVWPQPNIPVCWETAGSDTEKAWVRDAVRHAWEKESQLLFTGWAHAHPQVEVFESASRMRAPIQRG